MMNRAFVAIVALAFTQALSSTGPARAQNSSDQEAYEIVTDAYVYAYPLLLMDVFMRQGTNHAEPTGIVTQAPYNQFSHARRSHRRTLSLSCGRTLTHSTQAPTLIWDLSRSFCRYRRPTATLCYLC